MKIIVESGATKSDWRYMGEGSSQSRRALAGTNVSSMPMEEVLSVIREGLSGCEGVDGFYLYTAGVVTEAIREEVKSFVRSLVGNCDIDVQDDLVGAARAVLGHGEGIVAILGTGSNACLYDGSTVHTKVKSGGFILGDDGGASVLGKRFIADFLKNRIPEPIASEFASSFDVSYPTIVENVYRAGRPAAYLGAFAPFIVSRYDNPYIRTLVDNNFRDFIEKMLKAYDTRTYGVGVVGGFGCACRDIFSRICAEEGVRVNGYVAAPIDGLLRYHGCGDKYLEENL